MFGRKNKTQTKIEELENRIVSLAEKVEQNNNDIGDLVELFDVSLTPELGREWRP